MTEAIAPEVEVSLVDQITGILASRGHPHPEAWKSVPFALHPHAIESRDHNVQRFLINRQWQLILGTSGVDTMDARYCLVDNGSDEDWLASFTNGVAPCIIAHSLPRLPQ
jgi:hypothetical protein